MIHVILFHDSGGFQSSFLSVNTYMNEGESKLSNDAHCASISPTKLKNNKVLVCKSYPEHTVYVYVCMCVKATKTTVTKVYTSTTDFHLPQVVQKARANHLFGDKSESDTYHEEHE